MSTSTENGSQQRLPSSDPPNSPAALFDSHLRFLTDSYLGFFQERKRLEEIYVESLIRLHRKCKQIDAYLDDRSEPSTTRSAWGEIRDNIEREADTRNAFINTLSTDVLEPLNNLRETQERIRKRIREDTKDAAIAHIEYAENVYPKLKRAYLKKAQEYEEIKTSQDKDREKPPPTSPAEYLPTAPRTSTSSATRPVVTAPQPLRPLERRASGSVHPSRRERSPSSSTALQDLAHQGKKQLNQLMTFLDKGNVKDGRSEQAVKTVKAKREAEEADKEYRKGVHWLETLRLQRLKIFESGYKSFESFLRESASTMKFVLERYTDNFTATATTQTQLCNHAMKMVDKISPERDSMAIAPHIPRLIATFVPKPVFYFNYHVGECRDLIFGVTLVDYAVSRGLPDGEIPKIIYLCIKEIDERGLETEGIYRVSGRHAAVQELQHKIERNEAAFAFQAPYDDVYAVSALLKQYLRQLPEPLFRFSLQDRVQHTGGIDDHIANDFQVLRAKIRRLPPVHQATLKALSEHLARVAARCEKNKMDPKNLAISFGTVIFGEDEMPKAAGDLLNVQAWKDTLMEDLITHHNIIFQSSQSSPPLPPAPLGEPTPVPTYGSAHTKVATVVASNQSQRSQQLLQPSSPPRQTQQGTRLARSPSPRRRNDVYVAPPIPSRQTQSEGSQPSGPPEDFNPQLPARPANSIHPSLRSGAVSASPARQSFQSANRSGQWFDEYISPISAANSRPLPPRPSTPSSAISANSDNPRSREPSPMRGDGEGRTIPAPLSLPSPWSESSTLVPSARPSSYIRPVTPSTLVTTMEEERDEPFTPPTEPPLSASTAASFESAKSVPIVSPPATTVEANASTLTPPPANVSLPASPSETESVTTQPPPPAPATVDPTPAAPAPPSAPGSEGGSHSRKPSTEQ